MTPLLPQLHKWWTSLAADAGAKVYSVGAGIPGSVSPLTGKVQNANSTWLNGRALEQDLAERLGQPVRLANDANCLVLSEIADGAAAGAKSAFGVILGTGCGGGFAMADTLNLGRHAISGEWGHNPLPWPKIDETPGPACWCGRYSCLETWLSGPAISRHHMQASGMELPTEVIASLADKGDAECKETLKEHRSRCARGLAHVVNILDPEVIVLGGSVSQLPGLVEKLPELMAPYVFADAVDIQVRASMHGPESGVRGAARLWPLHEKAET